jgi:hypothetical protein
VFKIYEICHIFKIFRSISSLYSLLLSHILVTRHEHTFSSLCVYLYTNLYRLTEFRRWEDNIKMDLVELEFESVDWIHLAQDRDR